MLIATAFCKKAASHGMTVSGLLESFIGDLVEGTFTNGSDERYLAEDWFNRCGSSVMIRERCCGICWSRTQTSKILLNFMRRTKNTNRIQRSLRNGAKSAKWSRVTHSILKTNYSIGWTIEPSKLSMAEEVEAIRDYVEALRKFKGE